MTTQISTPVAASGGIHNRSIRIQLEKQALEAIKGFVPDHQQQFLKLCFRSKSYEAEYLEILQGLKQTIDTMAKTYEQDGKGDDAIVSLHYFSSSSDWWITEKDASPDDQSQAFGYACLNHDYDSAELGYISIRELCASRHVELDFHFKPCPLGEVKARIQAVR